MRARWLVLALVGQVLASTSGAQGGDGDKVKQAPFVAVLDLELNGVALSEVEKMGLYGLLASKLAESGAFQIVPREQIRARLVELKKESFKECYDKNCQIELGREVAAEQTLVPQIAKLGERCSVTLALFDVAKAASGQAAVERGGCDIESLTSSLDRAVAGLVGRARGDAGSKVVVSELATVDLGKGIVNKIVDDKGFVFVTSRPEGATVLINGVEKGVTPYQAELMLGRYVIVCAKGALYKPARQEIQLGKKKVTITMDLEPDFGVLEVKSEPPGASVELDGEPTGQVTPFTFPPRKSGRYRVKVGKDLYLSKDLEVSLGNGKTEQVVVRLEPNFGSLSVESIPNGIEVVLDGKPTGLRTPVRFERLGTGLHQVEVHADQYRVAPVRVQIERDKEARAALALEGVYGLLVVTAVVVDENQAIPVEAEVLLDGRKLEGSTPLKEKLLVGSYQVEVRTPDAVLFKTSAVVKEAEKTSIEARMARLLPEEVIRQRVEKLQPVRDAYHWAGGALLAVGLVGAVIGPVLWGVPMQDALDARDSAYTTFLLTRNLEQANRYLGEIKEQDQLAKDYNIGGWVSMGLGAAMLISGIITIALAPALPDFETLVQPQVGGGVGLGFRF